MCVQHINSFNLHSKLLHDIWIYMDFHKKVYGVDDELLKEKVRSIPRDDVAEVCLQSLVHEDAVNRSFDIISKEPVENTEPTTNWKAWFSMNKGTCKY